MTCVRDPLILCIYPFILTRRYLPITLNVDSNRYYLLSMLLLPSKIIPTYLSKMNVVRGEEPMKVMLNYLNQLLQIVFYLINK